MFSRQLGSIACVALTLTANVQVTHAQTPCACDTNAGYSLPSLQREPFKPCWWQINSTVVLVTDNPEVPEVATTYSFLAVKLCDPECVVKPCNAPYDTWTYNEVDSSSVNGSLSISGACASPSVVVTFANDVAGVLQVQYAVKENAGVVSISDYQYAGSNFTTNTCADCHMVQTLYYKTIRTVMQKRKIVEERVYQANSPDMWDCPVVLPITRRCVRADMQITIVHEQQTDRVDLVPLPCCETIPHCCGRECPS